MSPEYQLIRRQIAVITTPKGTSALHGADAPIHAVGTVSLAQKALRQLEVPSRKSRLHIIQGAARTRVRP